MQQHRDGSFRSRTLDAFLGLCLTLLLLYTSLGLASRQWSAPKIPHRCRQPLLGTRDTSNSPAVYAEITTFLMRTRPLISEPVTTNQPILKPSDLIAVILSTCMLLCDTWRIFLSTGKKSLIKCLTSQIPTLSLRPIASTLTYQVLHLPAFVASKTVSRLRDAALRSAITTSRIHPADHSSMMLKRRTAWSKNTYRKS